MNTLDLTALTKFTTQAQKLQTIVNELKPFLELVKELDGKAILPADRLIRAGEAAHMLGVSKSTVSEFCKAGLLTPLYVNSDQKRFWLSQVKALPRKTPWKLED